MIFPESSLANLGSLGYTEDEARFLCHGLVYHLFSRIVYRAIGRENLRNRRAHSLEHIRTRLVALDFVLAHSQYEYLETEDDKLNHFCQQLDIPKELLPRKRYSGAIQNRTTERDPG